MHEKVKASRVFKCQMFVSCDIEIAGLSFTLHANTTVIPNVRYDESKNDLRTRIFIACCMTMEGYLVYVVRSNGSTWISNPVACMFYNCSHPSIPY